MEMKETRKIILDFKEYKLLKEFWFLFNLYDSDGYLLTSDLSYFEHKLLDILEEYSFLIEDMKKFQKRPFDD